MQLIEYNTNDHNNLTEIFQNKMVMQYTLDDCYTDSELDAYHKKILENNISKNRVQYEYKVIENNSYIGFADFTIIRKMQKGGIAEIGYMILPKYWNKGYGTKIANALIHICFIELNLNKVVASCNVNNVGSWRIMEKVGMKREGTFLAHRYKNGNFVDEYQYGLLKN